ncbi:MAG: hypothetical protein WCK02_16860 [Bacteroidota bacterium]
MGNKKIDIIKIDYNLIKDIPINYNLASCPSLNSNLDTCNKNLNIEIERYRAKNYVPTVFYKPMSKILTITEFL